MIQYSVKKKDRPAACQNAHLLAEYLLAEVDSIIFPNCQNEECPQRGNIQGKERKNSF